MKYKSIPHFFGYIPKERRQPFFWAWSTEFAGLLASVLRVLSFGVLAPAWKLDTIEWWLRRRNRK